MVTFFGIIGITMAQAQSDSLRNSSKDSILYGMQFLFPSKIDPLASEIPRLDSPFTLLPKRLYSERILDFSTNQNIRFGIPTYQLPDPQSRMPIKTFDDSVNYTLQIKKYD